MINIALKAIRLATVAALATILVTSQPAAAEDFKFAIVMPGVITDKSFNQSGYEGALRASQALGVEMAYSEKTAQPDQPGALADYARRGYQLVIGHGGEFQDSVKRVASQFPDTMFLVVNGTEAGGNVATLSFAMTDMGYVMGFVAGKTSQTGTGAYIGAQKIQAYMQLGEGFEKGFMAARPDGKVLTAWTNDWDDVAKGKEAALNLISQGADVIFPSMDNAVVGSLQAAREQGKMGIGIYYDALADWPDTLIQSAILDTPTALAELITKASKGELQGKSYVDSFENEAVRIGGYGPAVPDAAKSEVEALIAQIIAGTLKTN